MSLRRALATLIVVACAVLVLAPPASAAQGPANPDAPVPSKYDQSESSVASFAVSCLSLAPSMPACDPYVITEDGEVVGVQIGDQSWGKTERGKEADPITDPPEQSDGEQCASFDFTCKFAELVETGLERVAAAVAEFAGETLATVGTLWVEVPVPQLVIADQPTDEIQDVQDPLRWYVLAIAVLCILIGAGRIMITARGQDLRSLLHGLVLMVAVSVLGLVVIDLLIQAADGLANWLLSPTGPLEGDRDFGENLFSMFASLFGNAADKLPSPYDSYASTYAAGEGTVLSIFGIILGGIILLLISLVQAVLMLGRGAMLVVMAVMLPLVASAAITGTGRQWLAKYAKWILALILYKPVAAIIYATAFSLLDTNDYSMGNVQSAILNVAMGFTLMGFAIVALPALLRVLAPATSSVAGGAAAGGLVAGSVLAGGAALAGIGGLASKAPTGAATATSTASKTQSGGMSPPSGASQGGQGPSGSGGQSGNSGSQGGQGQSGSSGQSGGSGSQGGQGPSGAGGQSGNSGSQGGQGPSGAGGQSSNSGSQGGQGPSGSHRSQPRPADAFAAGQSFASGANDSLDSDQRGE